MDPKVGHVRASFKVAPEATQLFVYTYICLQTTLLAQNVFLALQLIKSKTGRVKDREGAAIAQWIRLRLPSCRPGFESQANHLSFYFIYYSQICAIFVIIL